MQGNTADNNRKLAVWLLACCALVFAMVGVKTQRYRLLLVCLTFFALTGVARVRFQELDAEGLVWCLRLFAIITTSISLAHLMRQRRAN